MAPAASGGRPRKRLSPRRAKIWIMSVSILMAAVEALKLGHEGVEPGLRLGERLQGRQREERRGPGPEREREMGEVAALDQRLRGPVERGHGRAGRA